ncbi:MAG: hypothetical protein FJ010_00740 [Chloroflexi bacterium]|nr:hypothetical protein [Chloroflexota bacterium]
MLDDLREQADSAVFLEDEDAFSDRGLSAPAYTLFLGMTPVQRFIIALMVMMTVCILSAFCLLVTEKIAFPFL